MQSYEDGYRQALKDTIRHIDARMLESKVHADEWEHAGEFREFMRALDICKRYFEWILESENNSN